MGGFDRAGVDGEFFADGRWRSLLVVNVGAAMPTATATASRAWTSRTSRGRSERALGALRQRRAAPARRLSPGEEGAAAERAVEARPALALAQLLLEAVEAAEAPAEVVGHVDERRLTRRRHDGASVLEACRGGRG